MQQGFTELISKHKILFSVLTISTNLILKLIRIMIKPIELKTGSVIVVALHKLGDTVFTIPAIRKIENHFKDRSIKIVCYTQNAPVYEITFPEKNIIAFPAESFRFGGRLASRKSRKTLKSQKPEYIFDLTEGMTSVSLIFNSRAREIIGFNREQFKSIYTHHSAKIEVAHISQMYLKVLQLYFQNSDTFLSEVFPIKINSAGRILIHPFAGWKAKEWNFNKYIALAKHLSKKFRVEFVIPGDMKNSNLVDIIRDEGFNVVVTFTTQDLISELKSALLLISNDSGPIYISGLLGTPTFTIFGPTNPLFHNLGGKYHRYIQKKIDCSPLPDEKLCFTEGGKVGCPSFECMNLLSENVVQEEVDNFIDSMKIPQEGN